MIEPLEREKGSVGVGQWRGVNIGPDTEFQGPKEGRVPAESEGGGVDDGSPTGKKGPDSATKTTLPTGGEGVGVKKSEINDARKRSRSYRVSNLEKRKTP